MAIVLFYIGFALNTRAQITIKDLRISLTCLPLFGLSKKDQIFIIRNKNYSIKTLAVL